MSFINWFRVNDAETVSILNARNLEFWDIFAKAECFQSCPFSSLRLKGNSKRKIEKYLKKKKIVLLANSLL